MSKPFDAMVHHAEVLLNIPFPNDLPRCLPPSPGYLRSRLLYDIHFDNGPPPMALGHPSDLYIDEHNRIYAKTHESWEEWTSQTIDWPQDPRKHQPLTSDLFLRYSDNRGIGWAKSTTCSQDQPKRTMVYNTIYYLQKKQEIASREDGQDLGTFVATDAMYPRPHSPFYSHSPRPSVPALSTSSITQRRSQRLSKHQPDDDEKASSDEDQPETDQAPKNSMVRAFIVVFLTPPDI